MGSTDRKQSGMGGGKKGSSLRKTWIQTEIFGAALVAFLVFLATQEPRSAVLKKDMKNAALVEVEEVVESVRDCGKKIFDPSDAGRKAGDRDKKKASFQALKDLMEACSGMFTSASIELRTGSVRAVVISVASHPWDEMDSAGRTDLVHRLFHRLNDSNPGFFRYIMFEFDDGRADLELDFIGHI